MQITLKVSCEAYQSNIIHTNMLTLCDIIFYTVLIMKACRKGLHQYDRAAHDTCPECKADSQKTWKSYNREKVIESAKKYKTTHLEKVRARGREFGRRYYAANREKEIERRRRYREANSDKLRGAHKKWKYDITQEEWDRLFEHQGRRCAICGATDPGSKSGWHTDHSHETEKVRGILCAMHNTGIGHFRDNVEHLQAAIAYLMKHK